MTTTPQELSLLNAYCTSALYSARLLGQMSRRAQDPRLRLEMAKHANDALRHAEIWAETVRALGCRPQAKSGGCQTRYQAHAGRPDTLLHALVLTQTFERRLARQLIRHFHSSDVHPVVRSSLRRMIEEELRPDWTAAWLAEQFGNDPRRLLELQAQYADANALLPDLFAETQLQQTAA
jgi:hypothetical protein